MNALTRFGRWLIRHPKSVLLAVFVVVVVALGVIFQNCLFMVVVTTLEGLVIVVPLTLLVGLVSLFPLWKKGRIGKELSCVLVLGFSTIALLVCCSETGRLINEWKVDAVCNYVEQAAPILDQIKAKEGAYPATLPVD